MSGKIGAISLRDALVKDVGNRLVEVFVKRGFMLVPLPPEEVGSVIEKAFPLGRLKRKRGNGLDIIEFQFDKYGRPRFIINFGIVPEGGVTLPWGVQLDQNTADVSALSEAYRLYSSPFRACWFELGLLRPKNKQELARVVDKAIVLSDEIDSWFECKKVGRHMKRL